VLLVNWTRQMADRTGAASSVELGETRHRVRAVLDDAVTPEPRRQGLVVCPCPNRVPLIRRMIGTCGRQRPQTWTVTVFMMGDESQEGKP